MSTLTKLLLAASFLAVGATAVAAAPASTCPPTTVFTTELDHLDGYRIFTGPDGLSKVEPLRLDIRKVPLLKTGKLLGILELPKAPKHPVGIVVGPADVDLPMHAAPYKEMFVLLGGSVRFNTPNFSAEMKPGSVLLFEDTDSKDGHGGRTGPCGYISLSVAP